MEKGRKKNGKKSVFFFKKKKRERNGKGDRKLDKAQLGALCLHCSLYSLAVGWLFWFKVTPLLMETERRY